MTNENIKLADQQEIMLRTVAEFGMVTVGMISTLFPESEYPGWSQGMIRYGLSNKDSGNGLLDYGLLAEYQPKTSTKAGRPEKAYLLTEEGAHICHELDTANVHPLNFANEIALAHRLCQAQIAVQAKVNNLPFKIEKVLAYDQTGENLRADVFVQGLETGDQIIEVEQEITRSHLPRAVEKFTALGETYKRNELQLSPEVLIVFNLPEKKLSKPIKIWSDALGQAFPDQVIPFRVYYCTVKEFMATLSFHNVTLYTQLVANIKPKRKLRITISKPSASESVMITPSTTPMVVFESDFLNVDQVYKEVPPIQDDLDRLYYFCRIALKIYRQSFAKHNRKTYGAFPSRSLFYLKYFLNLPRNEKLLHALKDELLRAFEKQSGVMLFRYALTHLIWDVFLYYFGFGCGLDLVAFVEVPDPGDRQSSGFRIAARVSLILRDDLKSVGDLDEIEEALTWMLTALITYPAQLGLIDNLVSSRKRRGA